MDLLYSQKDSHSVDRENCNSENKGSHSISGPRVRIVISGWTSGTHFTEGRKDSSLIQVRDCDLLLDEAFFSPAFQ